MDIRRSKLTRSLAPIAAACLITAVLVSGVSPATAASPTSASASGYSSPSEALAEANELTITQAERVLEGQESFSHLLASLAVSVPAYAGGAIVPKSDVDAEIRFTEEPGPAVREMIAAVPLRISVDTSAAVSASELQSALEEAHAAIEDSPAVAGATGYADFTSGSVHLDVWLESDAAIGDVQSVARGLSLGAISIEVNQAAGAMPVDEFDGGQHLSNGCTSAFTVRKSAQGGVLSAAHCADGVSGYTFGGQVESGSTDAQWHKRSLPSNRIRYNTSGSTRAITTYYAPAIGASACNYGRATGYKCSTIWTNSACWPGLGCGFYAVSGGVTSGGDSGGPWFNGSAAFGVHKGTAFLGWANRSVFTYVGNALSSLGLTLCTTSTCNLA